MPYNWCALLTFWVTISYISRHMSFYHFCVYETCPSYNILCLFKRRSCLLIFYLATPPRQSWRKPFKSERNGRLSSFFLEENKSILHDLWSLMICREIIKLLIQSRICITFSMHDSKYICFSQQVLYILNDWLLSSIYSNFICIYSCFAFPIYTTYIDWTMTRINRHLTNRYWLYMKDWKSYWWAVILRELM